MIRPITCVAVLMACATGYYVYDVSHQVSLLDRQIEQTLQQTGSIRERIRMLHAEWTVRNRPERLQRLTDQYLSLEPTRPDQFVALADLASRLPPPAPATPAAPAAESVVAGGPLSADGATDVGMIAAGTGVAGVGPAGAGGTSGTGATEGAVPAPAGAPAAAVAPAVPSSPGGAAIASSQPARPPPAAPVHLATAPAAAPMSPAHPSPARLVAEAARTAPRHAPLARPRLITASLRPAQRPGAWAPPRPAPVRLVAAGYRAPAYRSSPRPEAGGSLLGMAHTYATGPLAPPAPRPMPYAASGGGG